MPSRSGLSENYFVGLDKLSDEALAGVFIDYLQAVIKRQNEPNVKFKFDIDRASLIQQIEEMAAWLREDYYLSLTG